MNGIKSAIAEINRRNAPGQLERYLVERYKRVGSHWAWVSIGHFNATSKDEARSKGRAALADKCYVLRATVVGMAPEGVKL